MIKNTPIKIILIVIIGIISSYSYGQISTVQEKFELPAIVEETSGLVFFNNNIITHNDSGNNPSLYEIDTITGSIVRTIAISNATNVDWEDIAQDDTYVYIADIGNNSGTRTDLKIYRILKNDYLNNTTITAEVINYSYEDQTDFSSMPNNHNFDAEAISIYQDEIVIFSKNWQNKMVNAYTIPKTIGTHIADKVSSYDINGLVTGAVYNSLDNSFTLTGYSDLLSPFITCIAGFSSTDFFNGSVVKTNIAGDIGTSQVEGITAISAKRYFISREKFVTSIAGTTITIPQKLYVFDHLRLTLSTHTNEFNSNLILHPNPFTDTLIIENNNGDSSIKKVEIFDLSGKKIATSFQEIEKEINLSFLKTGIYFAKVIFDNQSVAYKKIIKH